MYILPHYYNTQNGQHIHSPTCLDQFEIREKWDKSTQWHYWFTCKHTSPKGINYVSIGVLLVTISHLLIQA